MKTVFCIYYRDMHTALSGLLCFENAKKAQYCYDFFIKQTRALDREIDKLGDEFRETANDIYAELLNSLCNESIDMVEEIDYRDVKDISYYGKWRKCYETEDIKYICVNVNRIDLYM